MNLCRHSFVPKREEELCGVNVCWLLGLVLGLCWVCARFFHLVCRLVLSVPYQAYLARELKTKKIYKVF